MSKSQQYFMQGKQKHTAKKHLPYQQLEEIFRSLPLSIVACDCQNKILWLNTRAQGLFKLPPDQQCQGEDFDEFLGPYIKQQQPIFATLGPECTGKTEAKQAAESSILLETPCGEQKRVRLSSAPICKSSRKSDNGALYTFREISPQELEALRLHCVLQTIMALNRSIAHLPAHFPEPITEALPAGSLLLSPPVVFIAQHLADLIHTMLDCSRVSLKATGTNGYCYFVAGSGYARGQTRPEQEVSGRMTLTELLGPSAVEKLTRKQTVTLRADQVHLPADIDHLTAESLLLVPLSLEKELPDLLCIIKEGSDSSYTKEEIELVTAIAAHAVMLMQYLYAAQQQTEALAKEQALQEVYQFTQEFLVLAGHELRTPLTGILGNLQLAQRRLDALQNQDIQHKDGLKQQLVLAQRPLASASQSAQVQQRMINDIIDDARLQTNQFKIEPQECKLLTLLRTAIANQRQSRPEHAIQLEVPASISEIIVDADIERITRAFTTYLDNAQTYSPPEKRVTVTVTVDEKVVRVSVHNEGPGIPLAEQESIWQRFYRTKGNFVQNELDLSLGLRLYLCRASIEYHGGQVGVQSELGHGATFWFTLPVAKVLAAGQQDTLATADH